jgi:hypothetical protein
VIPILCMTPYRNASPQSRHIQGDQQTNRCLILRFGKQRLTIRGSKIRCHEKFTHTRFFAYVVQTTIKLRCKHEEDACNNDRLMFDVHSQDEKLLSMNMFLQTPCQAVCQTEFLRHLFVCLFAEHPALDARVW